MTRHNGKMCELVKIALEALHEAKLKEKYTVITFDKAKQYAVLIKPIFNKEATKGYILQ